MLSRAGCAFLIMCVLFDRGVARAHSRASALDGPEASRLAESFLATGDPAIERAVRDVRASDRRLAALDARMQALVAGEDAPVDALDAEYAREIALRDAGLKGVAHALAPDGAPIESGTVLPLDAPIFDEVCVKLGSRDPEAFRKWVGGGVYLLSPYDPAKRVVLLVHGMAGSPRNFREIAGAIDPARYQVWVAYFASGDTIEASAQLVGRAAADLVERYHPRDLVVIAHSLGGLVWRARDLPFADAGAETVDPLVRTIYTLCTLHHGVNFRPLSGVRLATRMLYRFLPPYVNDILEGSAWLKRLDRVPPPPVTRRTAGGYGHEHLWYRDLVGALIPGPDDGLVPLSSTEWAGEVEHRTFDADHVTMLAVPPVLEMLRGWLAQDAP